jgi:hypothetical protein
MTGGGKRKVVPRNLENRTKDQLVERAMQLANCSKSKFAKMKKEELIAFIRSR